MLEYEAKIADAGTRLDVLVTNLYPQFSRSSLELLFDNNMVFVNGKIAKPAYKTRPEDAIKIDETYLKQEPEQIDLPVIYEDERVIVINKPAGILTHSKGALNLEPTIASFIGPKITDEKLQGNRAGIVHRLDRGTSGVIITAKDAQSLKHLQKQFSTRKVKKQYLAIVEGVPDPTEALVDAPIARNPKKPQTFKVLSSGKSAITRYKVLNEFKKDGKNYSLLKLEPKTGRTHQIRVHLAYIGHPVVGDSIYGHKAGELLLHAKELETTLPGGKRNIFAAPIPKQIKDFMND